MALNEYIKPLRAVIPWGFDDHRVKVEVEEAYRATNDPANTMLLMAAGHRSMLYQAYKAAVVKRLIELIAAEFAAGRMTVDEAMATLGEYNPYG